MVIRQHLALHGVHLFQLNLIAPEVRHMLQDLLDAVQRFKTKEGSIASRQAPKRPAASPARSAAPARPTVRQAPRTVGATALASPAVDDGWTEF